MFFISFIKAAVTVFNELRFPLYCNTYTLLSVTYSYNAINFFTLSEIHLLRTILLQKIK